MSKITFHFPLEYNELISEFAEFEGIKNPVVKDGKIPDIESVIKYGNTSYTNAKDILDYNTYTQTILSICHEVYLQLKPCIVENNEASKANPIFDFPLIYSSVISKVAEFLGTEDIIISNENVIINAIDYANSLYNRGGFFFPEDESNFLIKESALLWSSIKPYITKRYDEVNEEPEYHNSSINNILKDINTIIEKSAVSIEQACRIIELAQKDQEIEAMRRQAFALERISHKQFK